MREHGVLDRLFLIYEAGTRKFASNEDFDPAIITGSAEIVRDFIGNSHKKPCFRVSEKSGRWCRW